MQRKKIDVNSPEARRIRAEIARNTFTQEGLMVAFPTCLPGASVPIVPDESHITALDTTGDGVIYGGTGGAACHLFVAGFHGESGIVFDLGTIKEATGCAAVCALKQTLVAFVNSGNLGKAFTAPLPHAPSGLIQEWGLDRPALQDCGVCVPGEPVVHAVANAARSAVIGATPARLFTFEAGGRAQVVAQTATAGRIAVGSKGSIAGLDGAGSMWLFNPDTAAVRKQALPGEAWNKAGAFWARDSHSGLLYLADGTGALYSFDEDRGVKGPLGRIPLAPVGPMAVTSDGRVFGFCGAGMAKMFCFDPARAEVKELGVAVSVIEQRRYGYVFGDAVTGRDGEIVFGEDDNGGHLWLYFPKINRPAV